MRSTTRSLCVALALTLSASPAAAQFTAVVAPPKQAKPAAAAAAGETTPGAKTTSQGNTALAYMRSWVDSAAGVTAPTQQAIAADSLRDSTAQSTARVPDAGATPAASAVDASSGTRAPDTATMLPAIAILGLGMLGAGAWLLKRARA